MRDAQVVRTMDWCAVMWCDVWLWWLIVRVRVVQRRTKRWRKRDWLGCVLEWGLPEGRSPRC